MHGFHEKAQSSQDAVAAFLFFATSAVSSFGVIDPPASGTIFGRFASVNMRLFRTGPTSAPAHSQGIPKGAAALLGGSRRHRCVPSALSWRAACLPAWGEPTRPGLPLGETGKGGKFLAAAGYFCHSAQAPFQDPLTSSSARCLSVDSRHSPRFHSHSEMSSRLLPGARCDPFVWALQSLARPSVRLLR